MADILACDKVSHMDGEKEFEGLVVIRSLRVFWVIFYEIQITVIPNATVTSTQ